MNLITFISSLLLIVLVIAVDSQDEEGNAYGVSSIKCGMVNFTSIYCWWIPGQNAPPDAQYNMTVFVARDKPGFCSDNVTKGPEIPKNVSNHCYYHHLFTIHGTVKINVSESYGNNSFTAEIIISDVFQLVKVNPVLNLQAMSENPSSLKVLAEKPADGPFSLTYRIQHGTFIEGALTSQISVAVSSGSCGNATFLRSIEQYIGDLVDTQNITGSFQHLDHTIYNLQAFTLYWIRVVAMGMKGTQPSNPQIVCARTQGTTMHPLYKSVCTQFTQLLWVPGTAVVVCVNELVMIAEYGCQITYLRTFGNAEMRPLDQGRGYCEVYRDYCYTSKEDSKLHLHLVDYMNDKYRVLNRMPGPSGGVNGVKYKVLRERKYTRDVQVKWEPFEEENKLGEDFHFVVTIKGNSKVIVNSTTNYTIIYNNISKFADYRIRILPRNVEGDGSEIELLIPDMTSSPSTVADFRVSPVTNRSLRLDWREPIRPNGLIRGYAISWRRVKPLGDERNVFVRAEDGRSNYSLEVHDLATFELYRFKVKVQGTNGVRGAAEGITGRTTAGVPINHPENLQIDVPELHPDQLNLSWLKLKNPTHPGLIQGYRIFYCELPLCQEGHQSVNVLEDLNATLTNLNPCTWYKVWMTAFTEGGVGPPTSSVLAQTAPGTPSPPTNVTVLDVSSSSINITWTSPKEANGRLEGYRIMYSSDGDDSEVKTEYTGAQLHVKGYTQYFIIVQALSNATFQLAEGKWSEPLVVTTPIGTPSGPTNVDIIYNQKEMSMRVTWDTPESPNGPISFYKVYYATKNITLEGDAGSVTLKVKCQMKGADSNSSLKISAVTTSNGTQFEGPYAVVEVKNIKCGGKMIFSMAVNILLPLLILILIICVLFFKCQSDINKKMPDPFFVSSVVAWMEAQSHFPERRYNVKREPEIFDLLNVDCGQGAHNVQKERLIITQNDVHMHRDSLLPNENESNMKENETLLLYCPLSSEVCALGDDYSLSDKTFGVICEDFDESLYPVNEEDNLQYKSKIIYAEMARRADTSVDKQISPDRREGESLKQIQDGCQFEQEDEGRGSLHEVFLSGLHEDSVTGLYGDPSSRTDMSHSGYIDGLYEPKVDKVPPSDVTLLSPSYDRQDSGVDIDIETFPYCKHAGVVTTEDEPYMKIYQMM